MELAIDFDELVDAFEESDTDHSFFIDTQTSTMLYFNQAADFDRERLEEMVDERYLMIPTRFPKDDFVIMECFVYEKIQDDAIAEKFTEAIGRRRPFRHFKDLLFDYPDLQEQWFAYYREHLKNQAINWLFSHNIELTNQRLIPEILIRELTIEEINGLADEIKEYSPVKCMACGNEHGFMKRLFLVNASPENRLIEHEAGRIMKERFGITQYGWWSGEKPNILTASQCPRCQSEHVIWDYEP